MAFHVLKMATNYERQQSQLAGCLNDCFDTDKKFGQFFSSKMQLRGPECTKVNMLAAVERVVAMCEPGDRFGIFWSGHGMSIPSKIESDGYDEAILSNDGQAVFDDELWLRMSKAKQGVNGLLWTDSCHAVGMLRAEYQPRSVSWEQFAQHCTLQHAECTLDCGLRARSEWAQCRADIIDRTAHFAACQPFEFAMDARFGSPARANGAFTYYALQAWDSLPPNATDTGWMAAIVNLFNRSQFTKQNPSLVGNTSQYAIGKEPPVATPPIQDATGETFEGKTSRGRVIRGVIE
jgi:hypothetical protein